MSLCRWEASSPCRWEALLLCSWEALSLCRSVAKSLCRWEALLLCRSEPLSLCRWEGLSLCRCVAEKHCCCVAQNHCRFVAVSLRRIVAVSLRSIVAVSLRRFVAVSLSSFVAVSLCISLCLYVAVSLQKTMVTKYAPISDKKCIYSQASVKYDRQTIFALIDRRLLQNSYTEIRKPPPTQSNRLAAGASRRMGKRTDTIPSSAVVYYVIKDAYKAVRHREQDNELLTHSTAIFQTLSRQYFTKLQQLSVLRAQTTSPHVAFILLHLVYPRPAWHKPSAASVSLQFPSNGAQSTVCRSRHYNVASLHGTRRYKYKQTRNFDSTCTYTSYKTVHVHQCCVSRLSPCKSHIFRKKVRKVTVRRSEGFLKGGDETSKSAAK